MTSRQLSDKKVIKKDFAMASGIVEKYFFICACVSVLSVLIITIYIFVNGSPAIFKIGFFKFLFGME